MKLVCVITGTDVGGAETMLYNVLTRLSSAFEPHVISMSPVGAVGDKLIARGIPVASLNMRPGIPSPMAFVELVRRLRHLKPDVVHTWMYHADLFGGIAGRLARVRGLGWCIRNLDVVVGKARTAAVVRTNAILSKWLPDRILCCSEAARQRHIAIGYAADKMLVIPNGFDVASFKPNPEARRSVRAELAVPHGAPLVGLIGRWDRQKNHLGFLTAAAALHARRPDVHFLLAGQGVDSANGVIREALAMSRLEPVTRLVGLRHDVPRLMAALDVLASSSSYGEAFPNVLGEAMASGVPCAVTDVGDSAHIVGDTGIVVGAADMQGLSVAIESLLARLTDPEGAARCGASTRARIAELFEITMIVRRYEEFYHQLFDAR